MARYKELKDQTLEDLIYNLKTIETKNNKHHKPHVYAITRHFLPPFGGAKIYYEILPLYMMDEDIRKGFVIKYWNKEDLQKEILKRDKP